MARKSLYERLENMDSISSPMARLAGAEFTRGGIERTAESTIAAQDGREKEAPFRSTQPARLSPVGAAGKSAKRTLSPNETRPQCVLLRHEGRENVEKLWRWPTTHTDQGSLKDQHRRGPFF